MDTPSPRCRLPATIAISAFYAAAAVLGAQTTPPPPAATVPAPQRSSDVTIRGCLTGSKLTQIETDSKLNLPDTLAVSSIKVIRSQVKALSGHRVELIGRLEGVPGQETGTLIASSDHAKIYLRRRRSQPRVGSLAWDVRRLRGSTRRRSRISRPRATRREPNNRARIHVRRQAGIRRGGPRCLARCACDERSGQHQRAHTAADVPMAPPGWRPGRQISAPAAAAAPARRRGSHRSDGSFRRHGSAAAATAAIGARVARPRRALGARRAIAVELSNRRRRRPRCACVAVASGRS